ncbi:uncharacterized protein LOC144378102 [Ictidomys tridecemlineatus]
MASAGARGSGARQSLRTLVCPGQGRPWALSCARLGLWPWGAAGATLALRGEGLATGPPRQSKAHSGGPGHRSWQDGDLLVRVGGSDHAPVPLCPPPGEKSCHLSLAPEVLGAQEAAGRDQLLTSCLLWGPRGWLPARASAVPSPYGGQEACVGQGGRRWLWGGKWTPGLPPQAAGEPQAAVGLWCGPQKGRGSLRTVADRKICAWIPTLPSHWDRRGAGDREGHAAHPRQGAPLPGTLCRLRGQRPAPSAGTALPRSPCRSWLLPTPGPLLQQRAPLLPPASHVPIPVITTEVVPGAESGPRLTHRPRGLWLSVDCEFIQVLGMEPRGA